MSPPPPGYNCQVNIDECASNPCLNQGTCLDDVSGYTCHCMLPYTGGYCRRRHGCRGECPGLGSANVRVSETHVCDAALRTPIGVSHDLRGYMVVGSSFLPLCFSVFGICLFVILVLRIDPRALRLLCIVLFLLLFLFFTYSSLIDHVPNCSYPSLLSCCSVNFWGELLDDIAVEWPMLLWVTLRGSTAGPHPQPCALLFGVLKLYMSRIRCLLGPAASIILTS